MFANTPAQAAVFFGGAGVSLATSSVLVARIERLGNRFGASEALLGLLAAFAADTPEISSAITALAQHQGAVGAGVVLGSNVFNLAVMLGLSALVAGTIALHRRVVVLEGAIGTWVALVSLLTVLNLTPAPAALGLVVAVMLPYVILSALGGAHPGAARFSRWLSGAVAEEELELEPAVHPLPGPFPDLAVGLVALVVVVGASVAMEQAATALGRHFSVPDILVGTVVLAGVTSLPNAVAAVYLARRGRGAASLSTVLNSNAINVLAGLLLPAVALGTGPLTANALRVTAWYLGLTALLMSLAYMHHGLRRSVGVLLVVSYVAFVATVVVTAPGT